MKQIKKLYEFLRKLIEIVNQYDTLEEGVDDIYDQLLELENTVNDLRSFIDINQDYDGEDISEIKPEEMQITIYDFLDDLSDLPF